MKEVRGKMRVNGKKRREGIEREGKGRDLKGREGKRREGEAKGKREKRNGN